VPISLRQSTLCFFQLTTRKNIRGDHRSNRVWRPLGPWPGSGRPCSAISPTFSKVSPWSSPWSTSPLLPLLVLDDLIPSWVGNLWSTDMTMATLKDLSLPLKTTFADHSCVLQIHLETPKPTKNRGYEKNRRGFYICLNTFLFIHVMEIVIYRHQQLMMFFLCHMSLSSNVWAAPLGRCRHGRGCGACARRRGGRGRGRGRGGAAQQAVFLGTWSPAGWESEMLGCYKMLMSYTHRIHVWYIC